MRCFNLKILAKYSFLLQLFFRNNKLFAFLKIINGRHVTRKISGKTRNPGSNTLERITTEKRKKTVVKEKGRKTRSQCLARLSTGNIQLLTSGGRLVTNNKRGKTGEVIRPFDS